MMTDIAPIPFNDFRAELLNMYMPPLRAKTTMFKMKYVLNFVAGLVDATATTAELTPTLVARFIAARPRESPNTTHGYLATLRAACSYAESMNYLRISPFRTRKNWIRRSKPKDKQHHSREDISKVLALMARDVERKTGWAQWRARRLLALASTVAYTGMRAGEALHLQIQDVDLDNRVILIVSREGSRLKTERSAQPVPIPEALAPVLAAWMPHAAIEQKEWLFPNAWQTGPWQGGSTGYKPLDRMKRLGVRAGVQGFTFLSLRHSWATHAELWGLSDTMRDAVGGIDFGPGPVA